MKGCDWEGSSWSSARVFPVPNRAWEIWHQCESEIDPMSPALAEEIQPSGQARLGPILRGNAEEGPKNIDWQGLSLFLDALAGDPDKSQVLQVSPCWIALHWFLAVAMLWEIISSVCNCHWSEEHQHYTQHKAPHRQFRIIIFQELKQTGTLSQTMILSTPVYL